MLTPIDIRDKEFEKGRNYTREVREFLIKVSSEYEVIYSKNVELTDKIEQMESLLANYKNIEDTMKNALVLAQKTADSTIEAAKKEAENILINARMEANNLHVESIDKNNRIKLANKTLLDRFETYKKLCKDVLTQHLDMINLINVNFNDDDVKVDIDDVVHLTKEEINSNNEQLEQDYTGVVDKFNEVGDFSEDEINSLSEYDDYMDEDYHDDLTNYDDVYDELADIDDFTPEELAELDLLKESNEN